MTMLLEYVDPETQSVDAVVELLKFSGRSFNPLPEAVQLTGMVLVLSSKKDSYYVVTPKACSCPSAYYRPGQRCKHQRKYFPEDSAIGSKRQSMAETLAQADQNLSKMPKRYQAMVLAARESAEDDPDSIIPKSKWAGGFNGPCEPCEIDNREKATTGIVQNPKAKQGQEA
jgi:hypothetical protein